MLSLFTLPDSTPGVILNLSIILAAGFWQPAQTKKIHLPNVTGYILAGVLIGPYLLDLIPSSIIEDMDFITDIALALIAFGTGKYFRFSAAEAEWKRCLCHHPLGIACSCSAGHFGDVAAFPSAALLLAAAGCNQQCHRTCLHPDNHSPIPRRG